MEVSNSFNTETSETIEIYFVSKCHAIPPPIFLFLSTQKNTEGDVTGEHIMCGFVTQKVWSVFLWSVLNSCAWFFVRICLFVIIYAFEVTSEYLFWGN